MNDFKKRRLEYTKKLVENSEVLAKIEEDYGNSDVESDKRTFTQLYIPLIKIGLTTTKCFALL